MKTVSRVYDSYAQARSAVDALERAGVPAADISIVANKYVSAQYADVEDVSTAGKGAGTGAGVGGAVGGGAGLLAGLGILAIPGLGPVVAAGWLAATAVGVVAGATAGGLVGALVGSGMEPDHANVYSETVRRGGTLITVRAQDGNAEQIAGLMDEFKPVDPALRGAEYRKTGWSTFDPKAPPYRPSQAEVDRMRADWPN